MKFQITLTALSVSLLLANTIEFARSQDAEPQAPAQETESKATPAVENNAPAPAPEKDFTKATFEELNDEIVRVSEEINELFRTIEASESVLRSASLNPEYTSEAIEAKRKAVREAEDALIKAQLELREEIANLPELRKAAAENEARKTEVGKLRQQRNALVKLMRERRKTAEAAGQ